MQVSKFGETNQKKKVMRIMEQFLNELEYTLFEEAVLVVEEFNKRFEEQRKRRTDTNKDI